MPNKKTVIRSLVIGLWIVIFCNASWFLYVFFQKPVLIEKTLPSGAIGYLHVTNIQKRIHDISQSRFLKNLQKIEIENLMVGNGIAESRFYNFVKVLAC